MLGIARTAGPRALVMVDEAWASLQSEFWRVKVGGICSDI